VVLADISERGCRLLASLRARPGRTLTLQIPASVAGSRAFSLKGRVVRCTPRSDAGPGELTLSFDALSDAARHRLRAMVAAYAAGPSALRAGGGAPARGAVPSGREAVLAAVAQAPPAALRVAKPEAEPIAAAPSEPTPDDAFDAKPDAGDFLLDELELDPEELGEGPVELVPAEEEPPSVRRRSVALNAEAARVLLARDLTREGMRTDASPRLPDGAELALALHAEPGAPPFQVRVRVEQPAGEDSAWLRFADLPPAQGDRLSAMLAGLSLFAGSAGAEHALVVCEILDASKG
jgi:hypothetical protein